MVVVTFCRGGVWTLARVCNQERCVKAVAAASQLGYLGNARIYKAGELEAEKKKRQRDRTTPRHTLWIVFR